MRASHAETTQGLCRAGTRAARHEPDRRRYLAIALYRQTIANRQEASRKALNGGGAGVTPPAPDENTPEQMLD